MPFINDMINANQANSEDGNGIERRPGDGDEAERQAGNGEERRMGLPSRYTFDIPAVMKQLNDNIYGQDQALKAIEHILTVVKAEMTDPERPLYAGLFMGPTGVGKTEIIKVLAAAIHGNRNHFCRVDMNTLTLEHYAAALTGAPPGYVGSKEGSSLFNKTVIEGTYSRPGIILFDEIEKASGQVIQTLLNVMDNGLMRLASGNETIDFRNTIIFMTSNSGARDLYQYMDHRFSHMVQRARHYIQPQHWGGNHKDKLLAKLTKKELERTFPPEYLNRLDDILIFHWLEKPSMDKLIHKFTEQLCSRLQRHACDLQLEESAIKLLVETGYDRRYGGRALKRAFRRMVEAPLADLIMSKPRQTAKITYIGEKADGNQHIIFKERV